MIILNINIQIISGGSIEVKATQNYASYAFISKDYAKFRKETNFFVSCNQLIIFYLVDFYVQDVCFWAL